MNGAKKILIVGFGDVGERLANMLRPQIASKHQRAFALIRQVERAHMARSIGVIPIIGDLSDRHALSQIAGISDTVFHFAPPPSRGFCDVHTQNLLSALGMGRLPKRLIYISTTGVYGDCGGAEIDETRRLNPSTDRAKRRVDAESRLFQWGKSNGVAVSVLRAPGIYAGDRLPIGRLQSGTPALIEEDDVYTNHIHADDLARAAWVAATRGAPNRIYNVVDDTDLKMGDYFDLGADHFKLPRAPRFNRATAGAKISAATLSFMGESRRIGNQRLKKELGFRLTHPTVGAFLAGLK